MAIPDIFKSVYLLYQSFPLSPVIFNGVDDLSPTIFLVPRAGFYYGLVPLHGFGKGLFGYCSMKVCFPPFHSE